MGLNQQCPKKVRININDVLKSRNLIACRILSAEYEGEDAPKNTGLPNPRLISTQVHKDFDRPHARYSKH